jgi:alanine dehydrogenase
MTLFLNEADVARLIGVDDAIEALDELFRQPDVAAVTNVPRIRAPVGGGTLRITAAVLHFRGYYGVKVSSTAVFGTNAGRLFYLYKDSGDLAAIIQVFTLGTFRTGAASAIATRYMARPDASVLAVIGSGRQAITQALAISRVRDLREIRVYSRTEENRLAFCSELERRGIKARGVGSVEEAVRQADLIVTATTATTPVLESALIAPGAHINAIGANYETRRELDSATVARASVIATDDLEQVRYEAMDIIRPVEEGLLSWDRVASLGDIVARRRPGRGAADEVTLFKSLGVAVEDVAVALRAYERAESLGIGTRLPDLAR